MDVPVQVAAAVSSSVVPGSSTTASVEVQPAAQSAVELQVGPATSSLTTAGSAHATHSMPKLDVKSPTHGSHCDRSSAGCSPALQDVQYVCSGLATFPGSSQGLQEVA